jgi:hypothetical protein
MKMKYLYMSFLLALVYSCSDSGDNSDYSEMLKKISTKKLNGMWIHWLL